MSGTLAIKAFPAQGDRARNRPSSMQDALVEPLDVRDRR